VKNVADKVTVFNEPSLRCRKTTDVGALYTGTGSIPRVLMAAGENTPVNRTFLTPPEKTVKGKSSPHA
jgi:hypothetical protein